MLKNRMNKIKIERTNIEMSNNKVVEELFDNYIRNILYYYMPKYLKKQCTIYIRKVARFALNSVQTGNWEVVNN